MYQKMNITIYLLEIVITVRSDIMWLVWLLIGFFLGVMIMAFFISGKE